MANRENRTGIYELGQSPELADLFRVALRAAALAIRTHTVGTVISYNPATQRARVRVDMRQVIKDFQAEPTPTNPNPTKAQDPVILDSVPVAWPQTAAGRLTFPLVAGDTGELHIQDRTLQQWLALGQPTDPVGAFTHSLGDAVFHPNIQPATSVSPTDPTATVLDGETLVKIGANAVEFLAKAQSLISALDGAITAAVSAAAPITPPNGDGGTAGFTAFQVAWNAAKANIPTIKAQGE